MRRLRRWATFLIARSLVRLLGFDMCRQAGTVLGTLQYHLFMFDRRRFRAQIGAVLGQAACDTKVDSILRSAYRVNTIGSLEVLSMADRKLDTGRIYERCRVDGVEHLKAARTGNGAILLATHSGNCLLLLAQLADQGWPLTIVYRRSPNMPEHFASDGLCHYGFEGVAADDGFKAYAQMLGALRHDRVVFAMMDHGVNVADSGLVLRFLGKEMPMPGGIAQLARHSRAPIVPLTSLAVDPVWHFEFEPQLQFDPGGTLEEDAAAVIKNVERRILAYPGLWSWPHRRWRKYPLAADLQPVPEKVSSRCRR